MIDETFLVCSVGFSLRGRLPGAGARFLPHCARGGPIRGTGARTVTHATWPHAPARTLGGHGWRSASTVRVQFLRRRRPRFRVVRARLSADPGTTSVSGASSRWRLPWRRAGRRGGGGALVFWFMGQSGCGANEIRSTNLRVRRAPPAPVFESDSRRWHPARLCLLAGGGRRAGPAHRRRDGHAYLRRGGKSGDHSVGQWAALRGGPGGRVMAEARNVGGGYGSRPASWFTVAAHGAHHIFPTSIHGVRVSGRPGAARAAFVSGFRGKRGASSRGARHRQILPMIEACRPSFAGKLLVVDPSRRGRPLIRRRGVAVGTGRSGRDRSKVKKNRDSPGRGRDAAEQFPAKVARPWG